MKKEYEFIKITDFVTNNADKSAWILLKLKILRE